MSLKEWGAEHNSKIKKIWLGHLKKRSINGGCKSDPWFKMSWTLGECGVYHVDRKVFLDPWHRYRDERVIVDSRHI
jgi:hypothetical protein